MAAILVLILFLTVAGLHLWLRSRKPGTIESGAQSKPLVPMTEPFVPAGTFLGQGHSWARLGNDGALRVGIDAFLAGVLGDVEDVDLPPRGKVVRQGDPLFRLRAGGRTLDVPSPIDGEVVGTHGDVLSEPWIVTTDPYGVGWAVSVRATEPKASLMGLKTGPSATAFLRNELQRWIDFLSLGTKTQGLPVMADGAMPCRGGAPELDDEGWEKFVNQFVNTDSAES